MNPPVGPDSLPQGPAQDLKLRHRLILLLEEYRQHWPDETDTVRQFRDLVLSGRQVQGKTDPEGHITASVWICSPDRRQALLCHHGKLGIWVQTGGHTDPGEDWAAAGLREAREETGLGNLELALGGPQGPRLFDLDIHPIPARPDTPSHLHYDLRFLAIADPAWPLTLSEESQALAWVELDRLGEWTTQESQLRMARKCRMPDPGSPESGATDQTGNLSG